MTAPVNPRHDPARRDRIIDACLDVIVAHGVAGTSARRVATEAGVPLGSVSYHFEGMDDLLHEALRRFADSVADRFTARLTAATTPAEARAAVAETIDADMFVAHRELVLTTELYTLAAREPRYRALTIGWMTRTRTALERHFDPVTARLLDAMVEGLTLHAALDVEPADPAVARAALERLIPG